MTDEEEIKGKQAGRVHGCQLWVPGGIQSGLSNDWEQFVYIYITYIYININIINTLL